MPVALNTATNILRAWNARVRTIDIYIYIYIHICSHHAISISAAQGALVSAWKSAMPGHAASSPHVGGRGNSVSLDVVRKLHQKGFSDETIRAELQKMGFKKARISQLTQTIHPASASSARKSKSASHDLAHELHDRDTTMFINMDVDRLQYMRSCATKQKSAPASRNPRGTAAVRPCASQLAPMGVGSGNPLLVQASPPHSSEFRPPPLYQTRQNPYSWKAIL